MNHESPRTSIRNSGLHGKIDTHIFGHTNTGTANSQLKKQTDRNICEKYRGQKTYMMETDLGLADPTKSEAAPQILFSN